MDSDTSLQTLKKYITKKNTLSKEAVLWLFRKDQSRRTEKDIEALVDSNLAMVLNISTKFFNKHMSISNNEAMGVELLDLFSAGVEGLHRAITKYDAFKGTQFSTYAYYWIGRYIREEIRQNMYPMKTYSYNHCSFKEIDASSNSSNSSNSSKLSNIYESKNVEASDLVQYIYSILTAKERAVFDLYYLNEYTLTETAKELHRATGTIQYHLKNIRTKLDEVK